MRYLVGRATTEAAPRAGMEARVEKPRYLGVGYAPLALPRASISEQSNISAAGLGAGDAAHGD